MRWAFVGGMADAINQDLQARKASEEEQRLWQTRMEMQEKIRAAAEEAQRKNRIIATTEDLNSGKLIEMTAGGQRNEMALPQEYVTQQRNAIGLAAEKERIEREREEKKFAAQLRKDDASISASEARAAAARATASLTPLRAEELKARTEKARRIETGEASPSLSEQRQYMQRATEVSDEIIDRTAAIEDAALKKVVDEARREALQETDAVKRLQALQEVAALVAANSGVRRPAVNAAAGY